MYPNALVPGIKYFNLLGLSVVSTCMPYIQSPLDLKMFKLFNTCNCLRYRSGTSINPISGLVENFVGI